MLQSIAKQLESVRTSAMALAEEALAKTPEPGTFVRLDASQVLSDARAMDKLRAAGRAPSRYAGIPVAVKDLFDIAGQVTTAGSVVLKDAPPASSDAIAIARLKVHGFIVLGRANMTEFAYSGVGLNPHYGTPRSVFDRATGRIPGGSSSGSAVAVADGIVALGIGTDTGGSCRIPAAFNGLVGFKPSTGRVPAEGAFPLSPTLDSIGPIARTVEDCAAADAIMAGDWDGRIARRPVSSFRIGVLKTLVLDGLDANVARAFEQAVSRIGGTDVAIDALNDLPGINARGGLVAAEAWRHHRELLAARGGQYDPRVRRWIEAGAGVGDGDIVTWRKRRADVIAAFHKVMLDYDVLIMPAVVIEPPAIRDFDDEHAYARLNMLCLRNTAVFNFLDGCAISIPLSESIGLMIAAPKGRDRLVFEAALALESH